GAPAAIGVVDGRACDRALARGRRSRQYAIERGRGADAIAEAHDLHRKSRLDVLGITAEQVEVDPDRGQVSELEQRRVAGEIAYRRIAHEDRAGKRRTHGVVRKAHVAFDHGQCLASAHAVPDADPDLADRPLESRNDTRVASFDRGYQALD